MRLQCEVEVLSRLLPTCGLRGRGRAARALLSLGRPPGAAGAGIYLMVCTARDRGGARYKVQQNVERLFTRFVEEGKATVRLREPAVDLCLSKMCRSFFLDAFKVSPQEVESYCVALREVLWKKLCVVLESKEIQPANVINLKTFLSAVRLAHQGNDTGVLPLSPLVPAKNSDVEKPKTKMIITSRRDYPLTKSFPFSLEHLQTSYCKLARIDTRVLSLKKLRKLDLSHNHIKQLPATLGDLVCLQELDLHDNHLEAFSGALCSSGLQKSLQFLDLSQNQIQALPLEFCQLRGLVQLRLDDNALLRLPCRIGQLSHLRFLSAARNKLPFLPSDFRKLCLENLDLFGNPFEQPNPLVPNIQLKIPLTLLECAARATVNHRIPYGGHLLPSHLCKDLEVAKTCRCGSACLSSFIQITVTMNLHHVAHTVVLVDNMGGTEAPILCYFCSLDCYSQFLDRHLQSNG